MADSDDPALVGRGVRIGLAAYLLWGFLTVYWKQLAAFDAFELIAWRMMASGVVMAAIVTVRKSWPTIVAALRDRAMLARLTVASLLLTVNWTAYVWAVTNDRVIETALAYFIAPLLTMALGVAVLHERPTNGQRLAFVSAAIAVMVLTISAGEPPWIAVVIAVSWSAYGLSKRNIGLSAVDSLAGETFVLFVPSVVAAALLSSSAGSVTATATGTDWLLIAGTGIATAVPLMLFARAAQLVPFTLLGPLNLLVPVINFGLGWLLYDEPMPLDRVIGFAFVWVALILVTADGLLQRRRRLPAH